MGHEYVQPDLSSSRIFAFKSTRCESINSLEIRILGQDLAVVFVQYLYAGDLAGNEHFLEARGRGTDHIEQGLIIGNSLNPSGEMGFAKTANSALD